ncbi:substrate-binding periplasmic protein [Pseudoduganella sp. OTU4001]|uniref:substrate-binding periplasmic protein n=1 Tax=Pseudoduganella sp. OTU4001 TaxID=3043854 RepID=UPI00313AB2E3
MRIRPIICLALSLSCASAWAQRCETGHGARFSVGVEKLQYMPLHTVDGNNRYGGYAREVLDAFAAQHGYTFDYVPLPINRLYSRFLTERTLDFKYPDNPKWREELRGGLPVAYSEVVVSTEEGAMVLPDRRGKPLSALHTLGTVLGFTPWPYQAAIDSRALELTTSNSTDSLLRLGLAGHLDAVYVNVDVANHMLAGELKTAGGLVFDPSLPHARSDFRLSTLRCKQVVEQFNRFLQREQGMLQRLRAGYRIGDAGGNGR